MRIVCPSCSAEYDVPESLVTAGRVVRCARCGGEWMPVEAGAAEPETVPPAIEDSPPDAGQPVADAAPEALATEHLAVADAPPSAMDRLASHSARPSSRIRLRLAWLASLAVLAFLGSSAYAWRAEIVTAWPPSARMYAVFGVEPLASRMQ
jgi:predicted Zn finger-like uncharacterized protein